MRGNKRLAFALLLAVIGLAFLSAFFYKLVSYRIFVFLGWLLSAPYIYAWIVLFKKKESKF